ncbi:MAG: Bax inhibitor-1/YccA family protein [Balneolales bacterium]|nr:Bax inhibitor-1/YccA family protein [Balneolales bacterium]
MQAQLTAQQVHTIQASFIHKVYAWMCLALTVTGFIAFRTAGSEAMVNLVYSNGMVLWGLILVELGLVVWLSSAIQRMSSNMAIGLFLLYSALNGVTLSILLLVYTAASIASTFFITAGTFGAMSIYGYFTKRDLTSWGNLLFMALIGFLIASVVNLFLQSEGFYWILTYLGVLIFVGLTAYDTQKIKQMSLELDADSEEGRKGAIMGALALYLDFINLFILLLRIFGNRR